MKPAKMQFGKPSHRKGLFMASLTETQKAAYDELFSEMKQPGNHRQFGQTGEIGKQGHKM